MSEKTAEVIEEMEVQESESSSTPTTLGELKQKTKLVGIVRRLEIYGAFVDIGVGTNAILHISKMGERVNRVADVLSVGDEVKVWVESIDLEHEQVTLTMAEPLVVEWNELKAGQIYTGTVTRLEKYGAFVSIGAEKDGLVHVSELDNDYVKHPSETVKVGDQVQVQVLGFNKRKRRIDLSRKVLLATAAAVVEEEEIELEEEDSTLPTAMEIALRRAMSQTDGNQVAGSEAGAGSRPRRKGSRKKQDEILDRTLKFGQESSK